MTTQALDERVLYVFEHGCDARLALMLYGSVARGTADSRSDVDLVEVVSDRPRSYKIGPANITQYVPAHLHRLAGQGSLFVLHLRQDGVVLLDDDGVLRRILDAYRPPPSYGPIWEQLAIAAGALDPALDNFDRHLPGLARLGIYVLRTAAYARSAELGAPEFDVNKLAALLDVPELGRALALRRLRQHTVDDVLFLRSQIRAIVPGVPPNTSRTVEAYAVKHSSRGDLAALFGSVLSGGTDIDYSALTLPPF